MSAISVEIEKKKRAANSPLVGNDKELKESNIDNSPTLKTVPEPGPQSKTTSYAQVTAAGDALRPENSENKSVVDRSIFRTSKPQGAFRDEIVVEVNTIDGVEYRGTVTTKEAIKIIFMGELGFAGNHLAVSP